jgi:hypothetical protein
VNLYTAIRVLLERERERQTKNPVKKKPIQRLLETNAINSPTHPIPRSGISHEEKEPTIA